MKTYPGFDFLRILAAVAVVFSHSFLIAEGREDNEPLQALVGEISGIYGVFIFFILSGFLVFDSGIRSQSIWIFTLKRMFRIVHAYIFCNTFVILFVCPFFYKDGFQSYFSNVNIWYTIVKINLFLIDGLYISGVHFYSAIVDSSHMPSIVNGSLWTLQIELLCYVLIGIICYLSFNMYFGALLIAALALILQLFYPMLQFKIFWSLGMLLPAFAIGMLLYAGFRELKASGFYAVFSFTVLIIAMASPRWNAIDSILFPLLISYPILWLGQQNYSLFHKVKRFGDPSYGIYLWGWPVQQVLRSHMPTEISGYQFALICIPSAILMGYIS
jgi:peptidoglycan/LPS O-acetylase OafA/YrhL